MLRNFGCTCTEADDGDDCIRKYADCVDSGDAIYDLVLMDFIMPSKFTYAHTMVDSPILYYNGL